MRTLILFTVDTVDFLFQPPAGPRAVNAIDTVTNGPAVQTNSTAATLAHESGSSAEVCVVCSAAETSRQEVRKENYRKKTQRPPNRYKLTSDRLFSLLQTALVYL